MYMSCDTRSTKPSPSRSFVVQSNVSLADKNWFKTGGCARFFVAPQTANQFADALAYAQGAGMQVFVLGAGANILVSDEGFDGLVVQPRIASITHKIVSDAHVEVVAGAGVVLHDLIVYCLENQFIGLEEFSGIPGTVGGAVYINLHYFDFLIADFLVHAHVVHSQSGAIESVAADWFSFGYNMSRLQVGDYYLVSATFRLKQTSAQQVAYAKGRRYEIIRHRTQRYPSTHTCGSFFRNFYDHEVSIEVREKKMVYIAYYLDKIGVKGQLCVGGAQVSYQHANMIVSTGDGATSGDVIAVARTMQELVYEKFGLVPQPECRLIGFKTYPLLR